MEPEKFQQVFKRLKPRYARLSSVTTMSSRSVDRFFRWRTRLAGGGTGFRQDTVGEIPEYVLGVSFKRIHFTPDLMPSDIVGITGLTEANGRRGFQFKKGPIFAHVVLADEINRATPKTQSAVFEAMEEKSVSASPRFGVAFHRSGYPRIHRARGTLLSASRGTGQSNYSNLCVVHAAI